MTATYVATPPSSVMTSNGMTFSSQTLLMESSKVSFTYGAGAAAAASGLLIGGGTTAAPCVSSVADAKFIELRCKSTATSGDNRLAYLRYELGGAAGGGDCLRAFSVMTAALGTAHGIHGSILTTSTTGYVTGMAAGIRGTLQVADAAVPANGTYYGAFFEIYSDGTSSSLASAAQHAVIGIASSGNATGAARHVNAIAFTGATGTGTTTMVTTKTLSASGIANWKGVRVLINGTVHYIPVILPADWA